MIGKKAYVIEGDRVNTIRKKKVKIVGATKHFYICAFFNALGKEIYKECFYPEDVEVIE